MSRKRFSIIIITFQRDDIVIDNIKHLSGYIANRNDVELVLVDNNDDKKDRAHFLENLSNSVYVKTGVNKGVSGGRNEGIRHANADFLVFIDDDAFIYPDDFLDLLYGQFSIDSKLGVLAFKSVNFYSRKVEPAEFPHTDKKKNKDVAFKTFRFIGVAHAFRASIFDKIELYDEEFFFGAEEFDLSYRAIKSGFEILYFPEVWVYHKKAKSGRMQRSERLEYFLLNKLKVGFFHLPRSIFLIYSILWTFYTIKLSRCRARIFTVLRKFLAWSLQNRQKRTPLGKDARDYIRSVGGQIWR